MEGFVGDGVVEMEIVSVQEVAAVAGEAGEIFEWLAGGAVEGVADEGMADGGEMDADLMGAAGVETDFEDRGAGGAGEHEGEGLGGLALRMGGPDRADERMGDEADGGEDFVGVAGGGVLGEGAVDLLDAGGVPVMEEGGGGRGGFGEEDNARGGAAEAVDRVGLGVLLLDEAEEGVFEEAAAGEGGQAAGFIDGEEVGVFVEKFEGLRGGGLDPGGTVPDEGLAGDEGFVAGGGLAVEGDFAVVQLELPGFGGGVGIELGEMGEEGLAVVLTADDGGVGVALIAHVV